jgi:ubiquinone/menaquinone biosynthesis C-methylase UbiE
LSLFGADFYLIIFLSTFQLVTLILFTVLAIRKKQNAFLSLVASSLFFLISNAIILLLIIYVAIKGFEPENIPAELHYLDFFHGLTAALGLVPIVIFIEIFENGLSFTQRSSLLSLFIIFIGAISAAQYAFPERVGSFISLTSPIFYILVGTFFIDTIKKMKERIRFENQKKKIRKMRTGIYLTFIIPKFIIGTILTLTTLPLIISSLAPHVSWLQVYDISFLQEEVTVRIFDVILNLMQTIGLVIMSLPIIYSRSVFFMQSRKISDLKVINRDGLPIFEFSFEKGQQACDDNVLSEAYLAISTIMNRQGIACQDLKILNFKNLEIMVEIRDNFAVMLLVDRPTKYLNDALEVFADNFQKVYPDSKDLKELRVQKLKFNAEKMIQTSFGLEHEEFIQIRQIVSEGFDKVADEYLATRSEEDPEVKLLPDFMKRLPVGARVLDAGCGAGEPITRILSERFKVTGVDISKRQIEKARETLPYCEFIWQDMSTLSFPDEYFDGIISYYAIPHIPREEHLALLQNFYRMIKPNGLALLCFGTADDPGTVIDNFFGVKMYWSSFDAETNTEMLKDVGFNIVWLKLIFDDITDEQHIFVLTQKLQTEFLSEIKEQTAEEKMQKQVVNDEIFTTK